MKLILTISLKSSKSSLEILYDITQQSSTFDGKQRCFTTNNNRLGCYDKGLHSVTHFGRRNSKIRSEIRRDESHNNHHFLMDCYVVSPPIMIDYALMIKELHSVMQFGHRNTQV